MRSVAWRHRKVFVVFCYPHVEAGGPNMRAESLLIILVCGLAVLAAPNMSVATPDVAAVTEAAPVSAGAADETGYLALQGEADFALALLTQAQGRRIAMAQLAPD
jgi:hypothetical protein